MAYKSTVKKPAAKVSYTCVHCGNIYGTQKRNFPATHSFIYKANGGYLPVCYSCMDDIYRTYLVKLGDDMEAMRRTCSKFDIYWHPDIYNMVTNCNPNASKIGLYIARSNLLKYVSSTYDDTLKEENAQVRHEWFNKKVSTSMNISEPPSEVEAQAQFDQEKIAEMAELRAKLDTANARVDDFKNRAEDFKTRLEDERSKTSDALKQVRELTKELVDARSDARLRVNDLNKDLTRCQSDLTKLQADMTKAQDELRSRDEELTAAYERIDALENPVTVPDEEETVVEEAPDAEDVAFWGGGFDIDFYAQLNSRFDKWTDNRTVELDNTMEALYKNVCILEVTISRNAAIGKPIESSVNALNNLLGSMNLKPIQKNEDQTDAAFGELPLGVGIKVYEDRRPIPEPDPELRDVDGIIRYISIWFLGHLCKMLNIKNTYSRMYEEELKQRRVERMISEEEDDEEAFYDIFGDSSSGGDV